MELEALNTKCAIDNSVKIIAECTATFADINKKVENVAARIVTGVASLGQEIASRELQLEKLLAEQNTLLAKRKEARARCA